MIREDTIVAFSSPVRACGRIIVRLSGGMAHSLGLAISDQLLPSCGVVRAKVLIDGLRVPASLYCFAAGHSYTGEATLEIHMPGNPLLADLLLRDLLSRGARLAEPGEFTARAFFSGRLDLTEAEGVAAMIGARSERELLAARRLCAGELAWRLRPVTNRLAELLSLTEAGIDFAEEDIRFISPHDLAQRAASLGESLRSLLRESVRFERLSHEPRVVLAGRPNAGKSTLMNALCGYERVVVSAEEGTTRDAISVSLQLARGRVQLVDIAGLSEPPAAGEGPASIERQMQEQAVHAAATADVLVWIREVGDKRPRPPLPVLPELEVATKLDLAADGVVGSQEVGVSVHGGRGLNEVRCRLDELAFGESEGSGLALNARHVRQISLAIESLERVEQSLGAGDELAAFELREALDALGEVTGLITPDDVLGRIFSTFCIGK